MKYIITESRLDDIIFKYLDMTLRHLEKKKGYTTDIVFTYPNDEEGPIGLNNGELSVNYDIILEMMSLFSMDEFEAADKVGEYLKQKYNLDFIGTTPSIYNYY
jgi:hypothetical protein